jgi:quinol monooxygenase YgiN
MVYTIVVHLYAKPEAEAIAKLKAKLVEASTVYSQDKETLSWFVMQDVSDERKFTIVERYLKESVCPPLNPSIILVKATTPWKQCGCI